MLKYLLAAAALLLTTSALAATNGTFVLFTTSAGNIELELNDRQAPLTVRNFVNYVNQGFYNGTLFHRVIPGFMIQGGGFTDAMQQKLAGAPVKNEADNGLLNRRGGIAMARTEDKDSATSQFFINVADNAFLDHNQKQAGYAVFGRVIRGMEVADQIFHKPTHQVGPYQNVPEQPIVLLSAKIITG